MHTYIILFRLNTRSKWRQQSEAHAESIAPLVAQHKRQLEYYHKNGIAAQGAIVQMDSAYSYPLDLWHKELLAMPPENVYIIA